MQSAVIILRRLVIAVFDVRNKVARQYDVVDAESRAEQRSDFASSESGNAAAYACHQKCLLWMLLGVFDELVDIRRYFVHTAVHGGNGIALALYADALSHNGVEIADCRTGGTTAVHPGQIAAEDEDLVGVESRDMFGRVSSCCVLPRSAVVVVCV